MLGERIIVYILRANFGCRRMNCCWRKNECVTVHSPAERKRERVAAGEWQPFILWQIWLCLLCIHSLALRQLLSLSLCQRMKGCRRMNGVAFILQQLQQPLSLCLCQSRYNSGRRSARECIRLYNPVFQNDI